jgi:hypothetical protein
MVAGPAPLKMTNNEQTTCADCGASFGPTACGSIATGYAYTRVPRFAGVRTRTLRHDGSNTGTWPVGPLHGDSSAGLDSFPALYDVEGEAEAARLDALLGRAEETRIDGRIVATAERRICYACCATLEKETMIATGRTCLYLVEKPAAERLGTIDRTHTRQTMAGPYHYRYELSNWPGNAPFPLLGRVRESHGYGFGRRYDVRTFRFRGPDGFVWSGRNAGDMQLARCKRTKERFRASVPTVHA